MTIDWDEAATGLKRDVEEHGGFLTMQREAFRERFGISRLAERNTEELLDKLQEHGMIVLPHPYIVQGTSLRVYDVNSEIGKIALAVFDPQGVPERALVDAVRLRERANAGTDRRSDSAPWLSAFAVFLQVVIGRPPEDWEDLDDERQRFQLIADLAGCLGLPADAVEAAEIIRLAGAVCAFRTRAPQWQGAPPALAAALADAARDHKVIFDGVLREAAKHVLGGAEVPSRTVDLGRLRLRYRREAQGGI